MLFKEYYLLFYDFSADKLNELVDKKNLINKKLNTIKVNSEYEINLINILYSIASKTSDLSSSIFALNYEKLI